MQMDTTSKFLESIAEANKSVLQNMAMSQSYTGIPLDSAKKVSLYQLAMEGSESDLSWQVFSALWNELTLPNTAEIESIGPRPPILYCADNISHLFVPSKYHILDGQDYLQPIHALDLALPRHFVDHLTGAESFPNGGIVLGATSNSDYVQCPPLEVGIKLAKARLQSSSSDPQVSDFWNPLQRIDQRVMDICSNLDVLTLNGISKDDAKALIEHWAQSGLVRNRVDDSLVAEKWTLSGGGILGELENAVVTMSF